MEIRPILSALMKNRTGALLIAAQVALTLGILCNALFVVNERLARAARPSGADEASTFAIAFNGFREEPDLVGLQQRDLDAIRAVPGVVAATWTNQVPMAQSGWGLGLSTDPESADTGIGAAAYFTSGSLVDGLGLTLVEGRDFTANDIVDVDPRVDQVSADVVMLTRQLAGRLFPDETNVVGKTVYLGRGGPAGSQPMQVIGVVDQLMSPFAQSNENAYSSFILPVRYLSQFNQYIVRTEPGQRATVMRDVEAALTALRNDRVLLNNRTLEEIRATRYNGDRQLAGILLAVTGGLLLVTASGIVGMASLWVTQRRRQIGTRRALGATRFDILRYFVTENLMITGFGVGLGVLLAIGLNLFLVEQIALPRLPIDYMAFGAAGLIALGIVAVLGPASRAAGVPPAVATRGA